MGVSWDWDTSELFQQRFVSLTFFVWALDVLQWKRKRKTFQLLLAPVQKSRLFCISMAVFFFFLTCFALYGTYHKASNTVRCLSLSFELKKKKKTALLCLKNVYITDDFAFEVPDRLTTCSNRPNSPKSLFAANSGRRDVWWERNADGVGLRTPRGSRYPFHTLYFDKPVLALLPM